MSKNNIWSADRLYYTHFLIVKGARMEKMMGQNLTYVLVAVVNFDIVYKILFASHQHRDLLQFLLL